MLGAFVNVFPHVNFYCCSTVFGCGGLGCGGLGCVFLQISDHHGESFNMIWECCKGESFYQRMSSGGSVFGPFLVRAGRVWGVSVRTSLARCEVRNATRKIRPKKD